MIPIVRAYRQYDPSAKSAFEVLLLYPGLKAVGIHRVSHFLYSIKLFFLARLLSEISRILTGIEIHPGARIGRNLIIDHGFGVVIGETAVVGDNVILYQGVTLGGIKLNPIKRHPTVGNHVVIGAGAKVLGDIIVGEGSRIGANSVVIDTVPPHATVVGIPARVINIGVQVGHELCHDEIK